MERLEKHYSIENKNYYATDIPKDVHATMNAINARRPEIKTLVVDTIGSIMVADEMRRMKEKGYDKWQDLAQCIWGMVDSAHTYRPDLTVIFIAHTQTERDDSGFLFTRIKTSGKKLDKICLEANLPRY